MNYKQAMWIYLITKGMVLKSESYYGDTFDYEETENIRDRTAFGRSFINWDKTSDVKDGWKRHFKGTFCDNDEEIGYLKGTLVRSNGMTTTWKMELHSDWSFCETVRSVFDLMQD
jgi:hypothetical protein